MEIHTFYHFFLFLLKKLLDMCPLIFLMQVILNHKNIYLLLRTFFHFYLCNYNILFFPFLRVPLIIHLLKNPKKNRSFCLST